MCLCSQLPTTEVQGISFVGYTGAVGGRLRLWNLQNLCPVPPYSYCTVGSTYHSICTIGRKNHSVHSASQSFSSTNQTREVVCLGCSRLGKEKTRKEGRKEGRKRKKIISSPSHKILRWKRFVNCSKSELKPGTRPGASIVLNQLVAI